MTTAWTLLGVRAADHRQRVLRGGRDGLVTIDRNLVEARAADGTPRFGTIAAILRRLSTYLSGAQLGITVTSLAIGLVAEPSIATLLRGPLEALGLSTRVIGVVSIALALLIATAVQMVFGELVPKNIALSRPDAPLGNAATLRLHPGDASAGGPPQRRSEPLVRLVGVEPVEERVRLVLLTNWPRSRWARELSRRAQTGDRGAAGARSASVTRRPLM